VNVAVVVEHRMVDVGTAVPGLPGHRVAADVFLPAPEVARPIAFCCLPGGGMSRRYWDLRPQTYSFAMRMADDGFPVISVDHIGTGDSALPVAAPTPLLRQVVAANDAAFRYLLDDICNNTDRLHAVGVGHSMGATLTIRQQAAHGTYDAVALMGFDTRGLPEYLPPEILAACAESLPDDDRIAELTLRMFGSAYPALRSSSGTDGGRRTLDTAATVLLGAGGLLSMLPGNVAAEAARLRVPVLVLHGEQDSLMVGARARAEHYRRTDGVTTQVFPDMGHNHNIAPTRHQLWARLRDWAESVIPT
jgi:pimeloyl-ACP methyl ester carboxylesterase